MSDAVNSRPRYSELPLPPYSYVPGFTPHPVSDPRGHMHGAAHEPANRRRRSIPRHGARRPHIFTP
jgi:hypothetical protein